PHCYLLMYIFFFFFYDPSTSSIYTLSLHDALPIFKCLSFSGWPLSSFDFISFLGASFGSVVPPSSTFASLSNSTFISCGAISLRSEEHTSELQSRFDLVCRLLLEKKNLNSTIFYIY